MKTARMCPNLWFRTNSDLLVESGFVHHFHSNHVGWLLYRIVE
jgi:hypothetical protein